MPDSAVTTTQGGPLALNDDHMALMVEGARKAASKPSPCVK